MGQQAFAFPTQSSLLTHRNIMLLQFVRGRARNIYDTRHKRKRNKSHLCAKISTDECKKYIKRTNNTQLYLLEQLKKEWEVPATNDSPDDVSLQQIKDQHQVKVYLFEDLHPFAAETTLKSMIDGGRLAGNAKMVGGHGNNMNNIVECIHVRCGCHEIESQFDENSRLCDDASYGVKQINQHEMEVNLPPAWLPFLEENGIDFSQLSKSQVFGVLVGFLEEHGNEQVNHAFKSYCESKDVDFEDLSLRNDSIHVAKLFAATAMQNKQSKLIAKAAQEMKNKENISDDIILETEEEMQQIAMNEIHDFLRDSDDDENEIKMDSGREMSHENDNNNNQFDVWIEQINANRRAKEEAQREARRQAAQAQAAQSQNVESIENESDVDITTQDKKEKTKKKKKKRKEKKRKDSRKRKKKTKKKKKGNDKREIEDSESSSSSESESSSSSESESSSSSNSSETESGTETESENENDNKNVDKNILPSAPSKSPQAQEIEIEMKNDIVVENEQVPQQGDDYELETNTNSADELPTPGTSPMPRVQTEEECRMGTVSVSVSLPSTSHERSQASVSPMEGVEPNRSNSNTSVYSEFSSLSDPLPPDGMMNVKKTPKVVHNSPKKKLSKGKRGRNLSLSGSIELDDVKFIEKPGDKEVVQMYWRQGGASKKKWNTKNVSTDIHPSLAVKQIEHLLDMYFYFPDTPGKCYKLLSGC